MHEGIPILDFHVPKAFVHEDGKLTGMSFEKVARRLRRRRAGASWCRPASPTCVFDATTVLVAVGQENAFPWIERDCGIEFDQWGLPVLDADTLPVARCRTSSSAATRRFGPKNIISAVAHGHEAAVSIDKLPARRGRATSGRRPTSTLMSQKMGIHEWSYDNDISNDTALQGALGRRRARAGQHPVEVELGFDAATAFKEAERCLNCDVQTVFNRDQPASSATPASTSARWTASRFTAQRRRGRPAHAPERAGARTSTQDLYVSGEPEDRPRDGQGRGRLPALRPVRRALPDRRLGHAEVPARRRTPGRRRSCRERRIAADGGAHDAEPSRIEAVNDFVIKFANVNGSGSASANELFAKAILRMGVPVSPRNIFPSNIQGLPTWYEVRVSERGYLGPARRRRHDGGDEPADLGRRRRRDRARRLPVLRQHASRCRRRASATTST